MSRSWPVCMVLYLRPGGTQLPAGFVFSPSPAHIHIFMHTHPLFSVSLFLSSLSPCDDPQASPSSGPRFALLQLGVAMGNAVKKARDAATEVVSSNDEDGVAEAIYKFALQRTSPDS